MRRCRAKHLSFDCLERRTLLTTFFVSTTGNDSAAGTAATPWRTLQHAADNVSVGDTVIVRPGEYAGFHLETDGNASNPITFQAEPGTVINARNAVTPDGINLEGADWIVIDGFELRNLPRAGIRSVLNSHVTIRNNVADSNGRWGIFTGFSDDLLIESNVTSRSGLEHGIYVSNSGDRPIIRGNVSFGNRANGIHMNGDISQGGDGIISQALVEKNVIYDNGLGGGSGINADGVQNSQFQNNLLYNNHASGISLYRIDGAAGSSNNVVRNNTIVMASDARWAINIRDGSTGNTVLNNILFNHHSWRGSISISADSLAGFTSDYNVVMQRFTTNDGSSVMNLADWRSATGQDVHSIVTVPADLFVGAVLGDYHLSADSPAIDAGTTGSTEDIEGGARPAGGGFDIGAYEFAASAGGLIARDDSISMLEDSMATISLLANDSFPSGALLTVTIITEPAHGTVTLSNGVAAYQPVRGYTGTDSFSYEIDDGNGGTDAAEVVVTVQPKRNTVELEPDPWLGGSSGLPVLVVRATSAADKITIVPARQPGLVAVKLNGERRGDFTGFGRIVVFGHEGADRITVDSRIVISAELVGGDGDDRMNGGAGADLIRGNSGNDRLNGGGNNDVLIGGSGRDRLIGSSNTNPTSSNDSDLIIDGITAYDTVDSALRDLVAVWSSSQTYSARTAALRSTGPVLNSSTVLSDAEPDELTGGTDLDWFFASVLQDRLVDRHEPELVNG